MRSIIISVSILFYSLALGQHIAMIDSMKTVIKEQTDSAFFAEWAYSIPDNVNFNQIEKDQLLGWFVKRTTQLGQQSNYAHFRFRQSIQQTIEGNYKEALAIIDEILPIVEKTNPVLQAACYNTAGGMIAKQGEVKLGIQYLKKAIKITLSQPQPTAKKKRLLSNHYLVLGNIYANIGQLDSGEYYTQNSYKIAKLIGKYGTKERCLGQKNMAGMLLKKGEAVMSIAYNKAALIEAGVNGYHDVRCAALMGIGDAQEFLKNSDSAIYYYDRALATSQQNNLKRQEVQTLRKKAYLYRSLGKHRRSASYFEKYSKLNNEQFLLNRTATVGYLVARAKDQEKKQAELELDKIQAQEQVKRQQLQFLIFAILGLVILGGSIVIFWYQRKKLRQNLKDQKIEKELIVSQMRAINSQMNPHFVFNALNSVQDLILQQDTRNANIYLGKFADLMRKTLEHSQVDTISLQKELDTVSVYLELEKLRFGDDFVFSIQNSLTEEDTQNIQVPSLLLQPYVENAIKHGLLHKKGIKSLSISIVIEDKNVAITIEDDGVGRAHSKRINERQKNKPKSFAINANAHRLELIEEATGQQVNISIEDKENSSGTAVKLIFKNNSKL